MSVRSGSGLILGVRPWGEQGAVVSLFCAERGLLRGLSKRASGAVVQPFNEVSYRHSRRLENQLGSWQLELTHSRAARWLGHPERALLLAALADVLGALLPEEHPYPALAALLPSAVDELLHGPLSWRRYLAFERHLLDEVGYGLRLEDPVPCPHSSPLAYVSPMSWRSVPQAVAQGYEHKLLPLPACWGGLPMRETEDFQAAWQLTGTLLAHALQGPFAQEKLAARGRLGQVLAAKLQVAQAAA